MNQAIRLVFLALCELWPGAPAVSVLPVAVSCETITARYVRATVYHAVAQQTDSTPLITADNSVINTRMLKSGKLKWLAVSRDLLKTYTFGDTVEVQSDDARYTGRWIVRDVMNKRYSNAVDFLVPRTTRSAPRHVRLISRTDTLIYQSPL